MHLGITCRLLILVELGAPAMVAIHGHVPLSSPMPLD
jgi:hypothetical protein